LTHTAYSWFRVSKFERVRALRIALALLGPLCILSIDANDRDWRAGSKRILRDCYIKPFTDNLHVVRFVPLIRNGDFFPSEKKTAEGSWGRKRSARKTLRQTTVFPSGSK
jgi:hypothetical protein